MTRATRLAIMMSILAVAVRLICIDQPYIDNWSWRQSDVAAIARNYFQGGFHFARPQIDWAGNESGYVGTEFPILPFLAAVCYKIFGVHEWVGRAQALILFAISLPFFFLLVRETFGELAAVWSLSFYSFAPLGVMVSRCFMPDMPSLALSIIGLYSFQLWLDEPDWRTRSIPRPRDARMFQWWLGAMILFIVIVGYGNRHQWYQLPLIPGAGGVQIMSAAWYLKISKEIVTSTLTPVIFVLGCVGMFITRTIPRPRDARMFQWWLGAMILFIVIVGYGNRHQWYQLPLIPITAAFAGAACAFVSPKISSRAMRIALSILLVASVGFSGFVYARDFYQPSAAPLRDAGLVLKRITPTSALVVVADNGDPTVLYYAERKGWHFLEKNGIYDGEPKDSAQAIIDLERLQGHGASYLVLTSNTAWWVDYYVQFGQHVAATSTLVEATSEFKIYKLNPVPK